MVVVFLCVAAALVQDRNVLVTLLPWERNATALLEHVLEELGVGAAVNVTEGRIRTSKPCQEVGLRFSKACFERTCWPMVWRAKRGEK